MTQEQIDSCKMLSLLYSDWPGSFYSTDKECSFVVANGNDLPTILKKVIDLDMRMHYVQRTPQGATDIYIREWD